jgi:hypothetical protein
MEFACPYCRGSGKFRHDRPLVSDHFWLQMTAGKMRCALCKGVGKLDRPITSPILDTGLIFCRTSESRILAGCPELACVKWIDVTDFFEKRQKFDGKCQSGHVVTINIQPTSTRRPL